LRGTPGFFRVGQARDGHWWLLDPQGLAFFSKGVAGVNRSGRTGGRAPQPGADAQSSLARHADAQSFLRSAVQRLRAWHFNTLGAWSEAARGDAGMYFSEALEFARCGPAIHRAGAWLPDVFDPAWREAVEAQARARCGPLRACRELIGYFTDDALGWAQPDQTGRPSLLQICLSLEPSQRAYHAAWEFVLATRRGDLAELAREWETELPNKETLRQLTHKERALTSDGYRRDQRLFAREFARRYFATAAAAIRAHDPDHLILGCRFAGAPGEVILSECAYPNVDVLSARPLGEAWEKIPQTAPGARAMPVLLVEAAWMTEAFLRKPATREPRGFTTVERMLKRGRAAFERVCAQRAVVGYEWNAWADTEDDAPPFGRGLVHVDEREAREHTELLTDLNGRAERLRGKRTAKG
jgi:agarase